MNLLILYIFNSNIIYDKMFEIQKKYITEFKKFNSNFDFYFIVFNKFQIDDIEIIDESIISIKGVESRMKILEKTIKSLEYCFQHKKYDFVIRTNISTIINFKNLYKEINLLPKNEVYTGGHVLNLQWLDISSGIFNNRYFGLDFVSGTCILMSYDVVSNLLDNKLYLKHNLIDDVAIGLFIRDFYPKIYSNVNQYSKNISYIVYDIDLNLNLSNISFIRNFSKTNRIYNIKNMENQIKLLLTL